MPQTSDRQMELEVEIGELLDMLRAADNLGLAQPLEGVVLYNPTTDAEIHPQAFEAGMFVLKGADGRTRRVPVTAISTWSALISPGSVLNTSAILGSTRSAQRAKCLSKLNALSLPTGNSQDTADLEVILLAWNTPITQTSSDFRHSVYSAIKKLENEAGRATDSYRLGLVLMERWNQLPLEECPPDFLIQLAYYRRWNRRTDEALSVSEILERRGVDRILRPHEKAILATERAAAFMDLYERTGVGLDQALRYLRYHHKLRAGRSDEHNVNAWKRYDALAATGGSKRT